MTYTISVVISGETEPNAIIRTFWGVMMGVTALILISLGSGGISALQSFIVITAGTGVHNLTAIALECASNRNQDGKRTGFLKKRAL